MKQSFAQRLKTACDNHTIIPAYGHGRQVWIATRIKVSQEAVRKWFTGESVPRSAKVTALAKLLEVDEAWLALGVEPEQDRKEKSASAARSDGAIYAVFGMLTMAGAHCAFPGPKDSRREFVDFYVIMKGVPLSIHVCTGREATKNEFEFILPNEYADVRCLGFVPGDGMRFRVLNFDADTVGKHLQRRGSGFALQVEKDGGNFRSGGTHWPIVTDMRDLV